MNKIMILLKAGKQRKTRLRRIRIRQHQKEVINNNKMIM